MAQGWDSARFVNNDDPFARTVPNDPLGSGSAQRDGLQHWNGNAVETPASKLSGVLARPVLTRHVFLLALVLVSAFMVGFGLWGTLAALRVSADTFVNLGAWTWLVVLGWAGGLVAIVWAIWATIRSVGHRAMPAVALVLGLFLPPFATFVGVKMGAELAAVQLAGDLEAVVTDAGWMADLATWLSGLIG